MLLCPPLELHDPYELVLYLCLQLEGGFSSGAFLARSAAFNPS